MKGLADRALIFLFCLLGLLFVAPDFGFSLAFLTAIAAAAFCYAASNPLFTLSVLTAYALLACFEPDSVWFLPLAAYEFAGILPELRLPHRTGPRAGLHRSTLHRTADRFSQNPIPPSAAVLAQNSTHHAADVLMQNQAHQVADILVQNQAHPFTDTFLCFLSPAPVVLALLALAAAWADTGRLLLLPAAGIALAVLLRIRTDSCLRLQRLCLHTRDDDTEIQMLLEERNRSLREKQDSEIYLATLRERNRIAREIHDNVGHMLTRSILMVGALRTVSHDNALTQPLAQLEDTLHDAMNHIRTSVHDLHDSSVNLQETLQSLAHDFAFCPVMLRCEVSPDVPRDVKYSFIAIVREALANIAKHSDATACFVTVVEHPAFYQLIIQDNGHSCCLSEARLFDLPGIGLKNMKNRIASLGGQFRLDSANGFRIYITVPRKESAHESPAD